MVIYIHPNNPQHDGIKVTFQSLLENSLEKNIVFVVEDSKFSPVDCNIRAFGVEWKGGSMYTYGFETAEPQNRRLLAKLLYNLQSLPTDSGAITDPATLKYLLLVLKLYNLPITGEDEISQGLSRFLEVFDISKTDILDMISLVRAVEDCIHSLGFIPGKGITSSEAIDLCISNLSSEILRGNQSSSVCSPVRKSDISTFIERELITKSQASLNSVIDYVKLLMKTDVIKTVDIHVFMNVLHIPGLSDETLSKLCIAKEWYDNLCFESNKLDFEYETVEDPFVALYEGSHKSIDFATRMANLYKK